jgi:hypothetical protein
VDHRVTLDPAHRRRHRDRVRLRCLRLSEGRVPHPETEARQRWTTGFALPPQAALALFDGSVEVTLYIVSALENTPLADVSTTAVLTAA